MRPLSPTSHTMWRKSSHSQGTGGECVELANLVDAVGIRDSKDSSGPNLAFSRTELAAFFKAVGHGTYDV